MLDWNDIPYFIAVAESGTLAGAAKRLSVNHSTVYRRINSLEEKLGVSLFNRSSDGYSLTSAGESVFEHASNAENSIQSFGRAVIGTDFQLSGRIIVTVPSSSLASEVLAPCIAKFHNEQPDILIDIIASDETKDLSRREADIALRATRNPPEPYLLGRKIGDIEWFAYASERYIKNFGQPNSMEDLINHKLIGANGPFTHVDAYRWLNDNYPNKNFVCKASNLSTISSLCSQGIGVALLPTDHFNHKLEKLFRVTPDFTEQLWILVHPDLKIVPRIKVFSEFLYDYIKTNRLFSL